MQNDLTPNLCGWENENVTRNVSQEEEEEEEEEVDESCIYVKIVKARLPHL